jgi:predicted GNAT family acetyltransferase
MDPEDVAEQVADDLVLQRAGKGITLVAEADGRVAATLNAAWEGDTAWMHNVATAPAFRGRGLATRLVGRLAAMLARRGVRRLLAHASADNAAARRAYEKAGMRPERAEGMDGAQLRYALAIRPLPPKGQARRSGR